MDEYRRGRVFVAGGKTGIMVYPRFSLTFSFIDHESVREASRGSASVYWKRNCGRVTGMVGEGGTEVGVELVAIGEGM